MTDMNERGGARYRDLIKLYRQLHAEGEKNLGLAPENTYPGVSILPHIERIKHLIEETGSDTVLDYGCGKGQQYEPQIIKLSDGTQCNGLLDYWDVDEVRCYDPCYEPYQKRPEEEFDGVICTDVLEHCDEEDLPWIVGDLFAYARRFVFASIACYPAKIRLPNGENAHCTVRPAEWWQALFSASAAKKPGVRFQLALFARAASDDPD